MARIAVRPRAADDLPACVAVLRATHEVNGYPAIWPHDPSRWLTSANTDAAAWVATVDGAIRGHIAAIAEDFTGTHEPPALSIVRLFVHPAIRGGGVGAALVGEALDYARANGRRPALEVADSGVAAIRLYERLGWRRVAAREADWTEPDGHRPTVYDYVLDAT